VEAAAYVGVTDRTLREWRNNGKLLVLEDGNGHLTFSKSTLEILKQSRRKTLSKE
jgi:excisionase family DNA binding protein